MLVFVNGMLGIAQRLIHRLYLIWGHGSGTDKIAMRNALRAASCIFIKCAILSGGMGLTACQFKSLPISAKKEFTSRKGSTFLNERDGGGVDETQWPGHGLTIPHEGRPRAVTKDYAGSEAEAYRRYYDQKEWGFNFKKVVLEGESLDISASVYDPESSVSGYVIHDEAIAVELTEAVSQLPRVVQDLVYKNLPERRFHRGDIFLPVGAGLPALEKLYERLNALLNDGTKRVEYGNDVIHIGSAFDEVQPLDQNSDDYLAFIRRVIIEKLRDLGRDSPKGFYTYPLFNDGLSGARLYNDSLPFRYHGMVFRHVLDAMRDNDERKFLENMVNFGTNFVQEL